MRRIKETHRTVWFKEFLDMFNGNWQRLFMEFTSVMSDSEIRENYDRVKRMYEDYPDELPIFEKNLAEKSKLEMLADEIRDIMAFEGLQVSKVDVQRQLNFPWVTPSLFNWVWKDLIENEFIVKNGNKWEWNQDLIL